MPEWLVACLGVLLAAAYVTVLIGLLAAGVSAAVEGDGLWALGFVFVFLVVLFGGAVLVAS